MQIYAEPKSSKKTLVIISLIAAIITSSTAWLILNKTSSNSQILSSQSYQPPPSPSPIKQDTSLETLNLLLLGYGGPGHQGGFLTDAIIIAHLNFKSKQITFITIPRDLWVTLPSGKQAKINTVFATGGQISPNSTDQIDTQKAQTASSPIKSVIANITGLPINYFIAIDFVGLQRAVGQVLDGIKVTVSQPLNDPWYPIEGKQLDLCGLTPEEVTQLTKQYSGFKLQKNFPCRYEHLKVNPGTITMNGADVLKYVRSRHGSSDFDRSRRQVEVIQGAKDKLFNLQVLNDSVKFFKSSLYTIQTDLNTDAIKFITPSLKLVKDFQIQTIALDTTNVFKESKSSSGAFILLPKTGDWQSVHSLIQSSL